MTDHNYRTARARVAALTRHRDKSDPELIAARRALALGTTPTPTYADLRKEGLSARAIETLTLARDLMSTDPERVATFLRLQHALAPVEESDVWPGGTPVHWDEDDFAACKMCGAWWQKCDCAPWDDDEDPSPTYQWEYTTGAGWSEKNAAVMRLVAGIESGEVA